MTAEDTINSFLLAESISHLKYSGFKATMERESRGTSQTSDGQGYRSLFHSQIISNLGRAVEAHGY